MKKVAFIALLMLSVKSNASEMFQLHHNARAYGMGGAYSAIVDDEDALFLNPAGIARNGGIFWTIADPGAGVGNLDALDIFADLQDQATFSAALDQLYGDPIWIGGSAKTSLMMPYFSAAYFYDVDISFNAQNPVSPTLEVNNIMDQGIAIGTGFSIAGVLDMGFAAKYITRTGDRLSWGSGTISNIISGGSTDTIFDEYEKTGVGYGFDMGLNFNPPLPAVNPTISFVWKNVGNTAFRAGAGEPEPPSIPQEMTVGAALGISMPLIHIIPTLEVRDLNSSESQLNEKIHMGVELGLPLIDLRAGLYQGYMSYGFGLNLGLLRIDAASWGTELGGYGGQMESRRYMVQLVMRLGFDMGLSPSAKSGGTGGASAVRSESATQGGSSSSSGGVFGTKRPKMRR